MMMAFVATVMTIGFAACSSNDDDTPNIYQAGFDNVDTKNSSATIGSTPKSYVIMSQIEAAYTAVGFKESFTASSDADVKAKAQQAEANIGTIDWTGCKGSMRYFVKNIKTDNIIYSKTFSSND